MNPIRSEAELRETVIRFMRYANTLSPHKLNEPIDPMVDVVIEDTVKDITRQHERELVEVRKDELKKAYTEIQERDPEFDREWFKDRITYLTANQEGEK